MLSSIRLVIIFLALSLCGYAATSPNKRENATPPVVEVNHLFVTIDAKSNQGLGSSEFLKNEFCVLRQETVNANDDESWTGTYLLGKQAYLEIFDPSSLQGLEEGNSGIGFSTQTLGHINVLFNLLRQQHGEKAQMSQRKRLIDERELPWFWTVSLDPESIEGIGAWLMETHEDYLSHLGLQPDKRGFVLRTDIIEASLRTRDPSASVGDVLFDDIVGVDVEASPADAEALFSLLAVFGYERHTTSDGDLFEGPHCRIRIRTTNQPGYRIRKVRCSLTRTVPDEINIQFGPNASLTIPPGAEAEWSFGGSLSGRCLTRR